MSQVVNGYAVTAASLDRLAEFAQRRDYKSLWAMLNSEAVATEPAYSYSGTVVSGLLELLAERGWTPVIDTGSASATALAESDTGILMCCAQADAEKGLAFLRSLNVTDEELAAFHSEFWGEEWDEAAPALREALTYLETTLALIPQRGAWALLFIN